MHCTRRLALLFSLFLSTSVSFGGWEKLNTSVFSNLNCITVHHSSPTGKVWACGDYGVILYSSDGGNTWTSQNSGTNQNLYCITFKEVSGGPVIVSGANGTILRTTNDGLTWTQVPSGTTATLRYHSDFNWVTVGDSGIILKSTDAGLTWTRKPSGTTARLYSVAGAFSMYAVGENGTILRGLNGGETWQAITSGVDETLLGVPMFGSLDFAVGSGGLILRSTNLGSTWYPQSSKTNAPLRSVEFSVNNTSRLYAVGDNGTILKTTDGGTSWGRQASPAKVNLRSVFFYLNDQAGFACGDSGTILRTTDGGGSFLTVADSLADMFPLSVGNQWDYTYSWFNNDYFSYINTSLIGTARLTVLGANITSDSTTWLLKEQIEGTYCVQSVFPPGSDTCYARVDSTTFELIERHDWRHRLYRNTSHFETWNSLVPIGRDLVEPSFLYRYAYPESAGTVIAQLQERPLYPSIFYSIGMRADSGLFSVMSRTGFLTGGVFGSNHRLITGTIAAVRDKKVQVPSEVVLHQNYPNPFNPSTSIKYQVPSTNLVTLKVFDVLGREVATLVDDKQEPGEHTTVWNPGQISSGVYFYRLVVGQHVEIRKAVLIR